jgi:hypothetical protein
MGAISVCFVLLFLSAVKLLGHALIPLFRHCATLDVHANTKPIGFKYPFRFWEMANGRVLLGKINSLIRRKFDASKFMVVRYFETSFISLVQSSSELFLSSSLLILRV